MFNSFAEKNRAFGLDVSANSIKLALLEKSGKTFKLQGFSQAALPKGVIINDAVVDLKTFNYVLGQLLEKPQFGKINTKYVVASLPEAKSFVRVIQIPLMTDAEAESAVPFEAENFIPMPIDQVYLDWQKIGNNGDKTDVLIVASPKEAVDKYLSILDQANLKPVALEVESQSCCRAVIAKDSKETALIADIQADRTSLIMVENGFLQFTSSIPLAGNAFTESIARALGVSSTKAEEIKKKVGIANTAEYPNIRNALLPVLASFSAEIKNILKFHSEHSEKPVGRILLSGGSAKLKNIAEFLQSELQDQNNLKVELTDPWINLGIASAASLEKIQNLEFTTALGLALRGVEMD